MKSATILPTHYLYMIKDEPYHMSLAHLIGKDTAYTEFYKSIGKDESKYLIMDNGVVEGNSRPIEEIVRKALMVNAKEIILPDVMMNQEATLELSYKALRYVKDNFNLKVMVVPQGKTMDEWLDCAIAMIDWDIDCIGVPKLLTKIAGRDGRLFALTFLGNKLRGLDVHLLGCWTTPLEATIIERASMNKTIRPVRGIDSIIAWKFANAGLNLTESDRPDNNHVDFSERWTDQGLLRTNIDLWKRSCEIADDAIFHLWN
jgi:hypothetical protein